MYILCWIFEKWIFIYYELMILSYINLKIYYLKKLFILDLKKLNYSINLIRSIFGVYVYVVFINMWKILI